MTHTQHYTHTTDEKVGEYLEGLHQTTSRQSGVAYNPEDRAAVVDMLKVAIVLAISEHRSPHSHP